MKLANLSLTCLLLPALSFASPSGPNIVDMTIVNNTDTAFTYTSTVGANPGNNFQFDNTVIAPHSTSHIYGSDTVDFDLCGVLVFHDDKGKDDSLLVLDQRAFHMGQPVFALGSADFTAKTSKIVHNPSESPSALNVVAATVTIEAAK